MKKKNPLQILEFLEPFVGKNGVNYQSLDHESFLLRFKDKDESSDFYFNVEQYKNEQGALHLLIDSKPTNKLSVISNRVWVKGIQLNDYFSNWLNLLEGYDKVKSVFDDPIIGKYQKEFETQFEILDDDAETTSFDFDQQIYIDNYLENTIKKLEIAKTETNDKEISEIINEVSILRKKQTQLTKREVIKHLSTIWAKARKYGLDLIKEIFIEAKKELVKELIKKMIGQ